MSKDTARKEVEKVCFAFEKAGKTGNKKDWGKFYDLEEPLINKVEFANQPKLSIPKKIAEMLDYCFENEDGYEDVGYIVSNVDLLPEPDYAVYYEWLEETDDNKNYNLALAYLAGKALGVELVSIEED